jgi:hypothetical protein
MKIVKQAHPTLNWKRQNWDGDKVSTWVAPAVGYFCFVMRSSESSEAPWQYLIREKEKMKPVARRSDYKSVQTAMRVAEELVWRMTCLL